jgi:hypothetical protein
MTDQHNMNTQRAAWAKRAIDAFKAACLSDDDKDTVLADLLGDLMHYADLNGIEFDLATDRAMQNYGFERDNIEAAIPEPPTLRYYAISGRVPGDDEDVTNVYQAASLDEAMDAFHADMLEGYNDETKDAIENAYGQLLYINSRLVSDSSITEATGG